MREILIPDGQPYMKVSLDKNNLELLLCHGRFAGTQIRLDPKIIPQLRQLLTEAEFFKAL